MKEIIKKPKTIFFTIFLVSVIVRLAPIIFFTGADDVAPGWYTDTYHHWQIGYFTKEVGFGQGLLKLWDLKGMEYFWGIGHPLVLALLMFISGSSSLLVPRLLSVFGGAVVAGLIAILFARWFNTKAAWAVGIWVALQPVAVFSDQLGMQEPLGLMLLVLGIYYWPKKVFLTGLFWGLAGTVRAEFWLFGLGLTVVTLIRMKNFDNRVMLFFSYFLTVGLHMKLLLDRTGNPIYPIYWNFLANAKGDWLPPVPANSATVFAGIAMKALFVGLIVVGFFVVYKKPKGLLYWCLGIFNLGFLAFMGAFSAYAYYFGLARFWVDRLWAFPYSFLGTVLAIFLFWFIPKKIAKTKKWINIAFVPFLGLLVFVSTISWPFMMKYFRDRSLWEESVQTAEVIGKNYQGGTVLIPVDRPDFTYALVHLEKIKASNIKGQMFTPFYYLEDEDPFSNWGDNREKVLSWLVEEDIRLLQINAIAVGKEFGKLVTKEPQIFELLEKGESPTFWIYKVKPDEI